MRASDVDPELYNQTLATYPSIIQKDTLKNNILYAWSRKPEDVLFTDGTIDKVLEVATDLAKVYGNANDIPLVSPSDQRNKVARLAVALAHLHIQLMNQVKEFKFGRDTLSLLGSI